MQVEAAEVAGRHTPGRGTGRWPAESSGDPDPEEEPERRPQCEQEEDQ